MTNEEIEKKISSTGTSVISIEWEPLRLRWLDLSGAMTMTILREPISRILSMYHFECSSKKKHAVNNHVTLASYIRGKQGWASNYYTRFFSGKRFNGESIGPDSLEMAKNIISTKVDLLLITEWLTPSRSLIQEELGWTKFDDKVVLRGGRHLKHKTTDRTAVMTREEYEWVVSLNEEDIKLYIFAKDLFLKRYPCARL